MIDLVGRDDGPPILNLGAGEGTSLQKILELAQKQVGQQADVVHHPARDFEVRTIVLDTTRLRELVNFEPTPLEAGIARTHSWLATAPQRV